MATTETAAPSDKQLPPRLHWTVLLALMLLSRFLFVSVWLVVQANWVRKVTGCNRALKWSVLNLCILPPILLLFTYLPQLALGYMGMPRRYTGPLTNAQIVSGYVWSAFFSGWIGYVAVAATSIVTAFIVRAGLRSAPIGLSLGRSMTLLFGPVYFQYFLEALPELPAAGSPPLESVPPTLREP